MPNLIICGSLCNTDIAVAELLARFQIPVTVLRYDSEKIQDLTELGGVLHYFSLKNVHYVANQHEALKYFISAKLIITLTGALDKFLRLRYELQRHYRLLPKTINISTGADITELVRLKTWNGKRYLSYLNKTLFNYINPYPEAINSLKLMNINNFQIIPAPYYLVSEKPPALPISTINRIKDLEESDHPSNIFIGPLHYLHSSNLDWGGIDNGEERNTTKGNDKFLKACLRALDQGVNIRCTIINRGPDKDLAKEIIFKSKHATKFNFIEPVNQGGLAILLNNCDIIVDQFDVGAVGGIAVEAMAQSKPVMVHIDKNCWPLVYDEEPPVINCHTEDEIYNAILKWTDRKKLNELGERAEKWVRKYHDVHTADFSEFILRVCLAAGLEWPRQDLSREKKAIAL